MSPGELLVAQISDTHLRDPDAPDAEDKIARLERLLAHLCAMQRQPDLLLVTGDLADTGSLEAYRQLAASLARCPFPAHVLAGNHDRRAQMAAVFGDTEGAFRHYALDAGTLRIVVLDTLDEGRHGGAFCETRAVWLRETLRGAGEQPVLIALHHPPIDTGLDWMTAVPGEPWLARLRDALGEGRNIVALVAGHVHRPIVSSFAGHSVRVCPATSSELALDLAPLTPERPDRRALVVDGKPGYALHLWRGGVLTTHFGEIERGQTVLAFDHGSQPLVRALFAERAG